MTRYDFSGNPIPEEPLHKRLLWKQTDFTSAVQAWAKDNKHIKSEHILTGHLCFHPSHNPLWIKRHEVTDHKWFIDVTDMPTMEEMVQEHLNPTKEENGMILNEEFIDRIVELTKEAGSKEEAALKIMSYLSAEYYVIDADIVEDPNNYLYDRDVFHHENETEMHLEEAFNKEDK